MDKNLNEGIRALKCLTFSFKQHFSIYMLPQYKCAIEIRCDRLRWDKIHSDLHLWQHAYNTTGNVQFSVSSIADSFPIEPTFFLRTEEKFEMNISSAIEPKRNNRCIESAYPGDDILKDLFAKKQNKTTARSRDDLLESVGYKSLGPILVGFVNWLTLRMESEKISRVFFLSRDGLIIMRAVEELGYKFPPSAYLYGSRKALEIPAMHLWDSLEDAIASTHLPERVELCEIFVRLGADRDYATDTLVQHNLNPHSIINSAHAATDPSVILAYNLLFPNIKTKSEEQFELAARYLQQEEFYGRIAIIDIGWYGHMQVALDKIAEAAGLDTEILGFYVGVKANPSINAPKEINGYLFEPGKRQYIRRCIDRSISIFEIMFSCCQGTCLGYKQSESQIEPVLADYTGTEKTAGKEAELIRRGALSFVHDWKLITGDTLLQISPKTAFAGYSQLADCPSYEEAELLGEWAIEEYGIMNKTAAPARISTYIKKPKQLSSDYFKSSWRAAFCRRLCRVPLNYGKIINVGHNIKNAMRHFRNH